MAGMPIDLQPADVSARVQVKSKLRGRPYVDLRLRNALRFAKDPMPCFVLLYMATNGCEPVRVFARHVWIDEIHQALFRGRRADAHDGDLLNRQTIRYTFTDADDHTDDLVEWMGQVVAGRDRYAEEKRSIIETVGFDEGRIHGTLRLREDDFEALIDHQIGLTDVAPPISLTILERRFGIDSNLPIFHGTLHSTHIRSHPRPARLRIRPEVAPDLWLDAEMYTPSVQGMANLFKIRIVTDFLELVILNERAGVATLHDDPDRPLGLASHRARIDVLQIAAAGPLRMMVATDGLPNLHVTASLDGVEVDVSLEQFSNAIACLEKASVGVLPPLLTVSQREIDAAWNALVDFNGLVAGTEFTGRFQLQRKPEQPIPHFGATACYLYDHVEVGDWSFGAVVRRSVVNISIEGVSGTLALGPARVVEAIIRPKDHGDIVPELRHLYREAVAPEIETVVELFHGDYAAMRRANARE